MAAKDRRLYARFDIGMDENPKIMLLSDAAFRALIESTMYARRQLTDGFLDERIVGRKWGQDVAEELTSNSCDRPSWSKVAGGYSIHDFSEHQVTSAEIEAKREAGRKGGMAKAKQAASTPLAPASTLLEQNASNSLAKTETETERSTPSSPATPSKDFIEFWDAYPKKIAKKTALKAWNKATETSDPQQIIDGAKKYAQLMIKDKAEKKFIKSPDGWLNAGRWEDELPDTNTKTKHNPLWD